VCAISSLKSSRSLSHLLMSSCLNSERCILMVKTLMLNMSSSRHCYSDVSDCIHCCTTIVYGFTRNFVKGIASLRSWYTIRYDAIQYIYVRSKADEIAKTEKDAFVRTTESNENL